MTTTQEMYKALEKLGGSPDAVARKLQEEGIRGQQGWMNACPIANFIKKRFEVIRIDVRKYLIDCEVGMFETPDAIAQFIDRFDKDYYPELQEKP
jgi:hypothetical protein